jgi:hypothetical protein
MKKYFLYLIAIPFFVAACGGGGGGDSGSGSVQTNADASGFWSDPTSDNYGILITKSGEIWGISLTSPTYTLYKGTVSTKDTTLTGSGSLYDNNTSTSVSITGQVVPKSTIKGSATSNGKTSQFSLVYDSNYEITPTTASIAGVYTVSSGGNITVASNGALMGSVNGCVITGTLTPATNENFFRLSVAYDQTTCQTNVTASGIIGKSGTSLVGGAVAGGRGDAFVLTKQ